ncbi:hypothetical protein MRX96_020281 [Rhipicephalus microplus]
MSDVNDVQVSILKRHLQKFKLQDGNIVFNSANGCAPINLDLVPFRVTGDATKQCIFGYEYYKKSDAQHQDEPAADWQGIKKMRLQLQGIKKKDCKAAMHLKYIEVYLEHKVELPQPCGRKENSFKASKAKELGEALQCERDIASEKRAVPQSSGLHVRGSATKGCSSFKPLPKRRRRC